MKIYSRSFLAFVIALALTCPIIAHAKTPKPPAPDLVIEKTIQTSSTFWIVRVKNTGKGDAAATTLKMVATPGGSYSCPVAAIKAGGTADVPCRMPFKAKADMRCEFILNPDKSITETNYANNRTVSSTNPKFN
jgi:CARDB protein